MHSEPTDILIAKIMNTPPYQLPPVVKASGCYTLDVEYLGEQIHVTGISLPECLTAYWNHVTKLNWKHPQAGEPLAQLPVKLGANLSRS